MAHHQQNENEDVHGLLSINNVIIIGFIIIVERNIIVLYTFPMRMNRTTRVKQKEDKKSAQRPSTNLF